MMIGFKEDQQNAAAGEGFLLLLYLFITPDEEFFSYLNFKKIISRLLILLDDFYLIIPDDR